VPANQSKFYSIGPIHLLTSPFEVVCPIWKTKVGERSIMAIPGFGTGKYLPQEGPAKAFDQNPESIYQSFGDTDSGLDGKD